MSRAPYFAGVLSLAFVAASLSAQTGGTVQANVQGKVQAKVQKVLVHGSGQALEVEIQTSGAPVSPSAQAITGPDRIVVDFPGALPSSDLQALKVNQGMLKAVRAGLFSNNPPTTRIVLDLSAPQSYRISTSQNAVVVKLSPGAPAQNESRTPPQAPSASNSGPRLQNAALVSGPAIPSARISIVRVPVTSSLPRTANGSTAIAPKAPVSAVANLSQPNHSRPNPSQSNLQPMVPQPAAQPEPPKPLVNVSYQNGLLSIQAEKASLSQVLFEVHMKTQADIAIPAGAEQEQVVANLGPAPARDVLSALLNGSSYNFIVVGNESALERVIISRRDPNLF
jgi:AMIN domain